MRYFPALLFLALAAAGCALFPAKIPPPSSKEVADSDLVARVSFALKEAGIPDYQEIRIDADGDTVTLRGPARSSKVIADAEGVARKVKGVKRVQALLDSRGSPPSGIPSERT
jgi:BON domain-containing protein